MEKQNEKIEIPENFRSIIGDFTNDLSITFPEYSYLWLKWGSPDLYRQRFEMGPPNGVSLQNDGDIRPLKNSNVQFENSNGLKEEDLIELFEYVSTVYPERFFDILYQNDDIFKMESTTNVNFLPNVDFKLLYHCENITEKTKKAIWNYLQLILFTITNSIKNTSTFGNTKNMFDGIDEKELQEKLEDTIKNITKFFSNLNEETDNKENASSSKEKKEDESEDFLKNAEKTFENMPNMDSFKKTFENMGKGGQGIPDPEKIHEHLKGLFDGKIGKLAKEMAEEISEDMSDLFGEEKNNIKSGQDVLKNMMKNPKKMMDLVKLIGDKLKSKMDSGEISQEEIMKEASDLIGKMKGGGGGEENDLFKNLLNQMKGFKGNDLKGLSELAGMAGMGGMGGLGGLGGLGKNTRIDKNKLNNMIKQQTFKEKMRERYEKKKLASLIESNIAEKKKGIIEKTDNNNFVFKIENETQEKSFIHKDQEKQINAIMNELNLTNDCVTTPQPNKKVTSKKGKKGKK